MGLLQGSNKRKLNYIKTKIKYKQKIIKNTKIIIKKALKLHYYGINSMISWCSLDNGLQVTPSINNTKKKTTIENN